MSRSINSILLAGGSIVLLGFVLPGFVATAFAQPDITLTVDGLTSSGALPRSAAFCAPPGDTKPPGNESPPIRWSTGPAGTKSYVLLMTDLDVPRDLSLINKPGVTIPADAPRMDIYHWVLVDLPPSITTLAAGADGKGAVPGGKPIAPSPMGVRGTNDYWPLFNRNPKMPAALKGPYAGYDGPCPPGNDLRVHRYRFDVYALDVASLALSGQFFAPAVLAAMKGHVLAHGEAAAPFSFP
jgi:Raf kinase inhibitor-like YbhB/YbcL family protein